MKKFLFIILSFIFITSVSASTKTFERLEEKNYGVNKHWIINNGNLSHVKNTPLVNASELIYDFADILTDEEEKKLYNSMNEFVLKTNIDMVFVSINMPYSPKSNENYAADFYDYNDFGIEFKNYSGILLLRNDYEKDKYYNIYTFGDAQLYFSYNRLESILDDMYSDFVNKNYLTGIEKFVRKCNNYYDKGIPYNMRNYYIDENGYLIKKYNVPILICLSSSALITLIVMCILIKKNRMVKKATEAKLYLDKSSINYSVSNDIFINSHTSSYTVSSSSGGGGSHSGSSGGGHSSGGGRHG